MAESNIRPDHGLSVRMMITIVGLMFLYIIIAVVMIQLGISVAVTTIFCGAMLYAQYFFSGKIAMFSTRAHEVTPEEEPELHRIVDNLCQLANMKKPKVGVAEMDLPNAFATGRNPNNAVVCVTRGIMHRLSTDELEAVLAHEISHVAHRDVAVMTIASGVGMLAGMVSRMAMWGAMLGGGGNSNNNNNGGNIVLLEIATMLVSMVVGFVAFLLTMSLSRYRELSADRAGAILIGKPQMLASALVRITGDMGKIPRTDLRKAEGMNAFFFAPALSGGGASSLFATHPSLQKRLDQLNKIERELNGQ